MTIPYTRKCAKLAYIQKSHDYDCTHKGSLQS